MKCTQPHQPGECLRVDTSVGNPKCVNCDGDHPASSLDCPVYLKHAESTERRRQPRRHPVSKPVSESTSVRWASPGVSAPSSQTQQQSKFPSYANIVRGSRNVSGSSGSQSQTRQPNFSDLSAIGARFAAIPNIGETINLFHELVAKLEATNSQTAQVQILMQFYCPQYGV